jgi:deazaflavin-dependent oxidoreductase (nitroreductase family)
VSTATADRRRYAGAVTTRDPQDTEATGPTDIEPDAGDQPYAWLTTTGRRSGEPRTVELWFVLAGRTVHFLAGGGDDAQWVRNADVQPDVAVRLGQHVYAGRARRPEPGSPEEVSARHRMATKYQGWQPGAPLSRWAREALCIAVDLGSGTEASE